ncbi:MAG: phosphate ABC transporter permease PstA, partial [Candidatus Altiarchaeales archaeon]|nr:phosphate ABC transporter permease PstA [Candidatus Altiarchaeales archaeon]
MISIYIKDKIAKGVFWISGMVIILTLFAVLGYVAIKGMESISLEFLLGIPINAGRGGGIYPAILGTLYLTVIALLFATPVGVGTAVYLTEFTREGRLTNAIRLGADTLNAVPSIVFGLFGFALFVFYLRDYTGGVSILSGGLTLGLMILPTVIRTSELAIKSVPTSEKEGSYALGATKLYTIRKIILPSALPGIVTGLILGLGRAAGETAPIIFTAAVLNPILPNSIFDPTMALTTHLYTLTSEGISEKNAFGTAL